MCHLSYSMFLSRHFSLHKKHKYGSVSFVVHVMLYPQRCMNLLWRRSLSIEFPWLMEESLLKRKKGSTGMISPLITVVINLYLVIISLLSAYFKVEQFKLNICFLFFLTDCGQKSSLKKVCAPQMFERWLLLHWIIKHFLCQSEDSLLLIQITHPIRCTITSHVITQTIPVTVPAPVWWPRISVRSSACVNMSVSHLLPNYFPSLSMFNTKRF